LRGRFGKIGVLVVGTVATCAFGYLAVRDVDLGRFKDGLAESEYVWLLPALGALVVAVWLRALRWGLLFTPATRPPLMALTRALLIGYFFNQLLPGRPGEAIRVLALHRETGTSRAEAAGTAVAERIFDVLSLLVLLFTATPFLPDVTWVRRAAIFALVFAAVLGAGIAIIPRYGERSIEFLIRPFARLPGISRPRTEAAARNIVQGLAALHRPRLLIPALIVTFLSWLVVALSFWCGLLAFQFGARFGAALLVAIATSLILVVPSAPAAVGAFEAAVVVALNPYSVDHSTALAAAVVLHALNLFPFLALGVWALTRHGALTRRRMKSAYGATS
jgi:glycosyltransferase 2 family protein